MIEAHHVTNILQTCSLILICNGIHTVCSLGQVRLIELLSVFEAFTGNSQKWITYFFTKTINTFRPDFYANATLLSQDLCYKQYISMVFNEYLKNLTFCNNNR